MDAGRDATWGDGATPDARRGPLPGLVAAAGLTALALAVGGALAGAGLPTLSPVFLAVVGGLAVAPLVGRSPVVAARLGPGLDLAASRLLRVAIVLLGLRFSLGDAVAIGGRAIWVVVAVVVTGLVVARLAAKILRIDTTLALLIGVGTAICGNSAIAAAAPIVRAEDEEVSFASVVITGFGVVAMVALPALGRLLDLDPGSYGVLAGAGVHDAAQAIAAGFVFGDEAGGVATVVKLARTAFLIPIVVALAIAFRDRTSDEDRSVGRRVAAAVPVFALGFVVLAVVRSVGDEVLAPGTGWWAATLTGADALAGWLLVAAMAAVGLRTRFGALRRVGPAPLVAGLVTAVAVVAVATVGAVMTT